MATIGTILSVLSSIPQIAGMIKDVAAAITSWYVSQQTSASLSAIADAAALAAKAKTDDERYTAALAWKTALSRPRVTPN